MSRASTRRKVARDGSGPGPGAGSRAGTPALGGRFVGALRALSAGDLADLVELASELRRVDATGDARMRSEIEDAIVEILTLPKGGGGRVSPPPAGRRPVKLQRWIDAVSSAVRAQRERRRWTQQELADRSGLPQSHISRIERGALSPSHKTIVRLADALGISTREIDPTET